MHNRHNTANVFVPVMPTSAARPQGWCLNMLLGEGGQREDNIIIMGGGLRGSVQPCSAHAALAVRHPQMLNSCRPWQLFEKDTIVLCYIRGPLIGKAIRSDEKPWTSRTIAPGAGTDYHHSQQLSCIHVGTEYRDSQLAARRRVTTGWLVVKRSSSPTPTCRSRGSLMSPRLIKPAEPLTRMRFFNQAVQVALAKADRT